MYEGIRDTPGVLLISYTIYTQKARIWKLVSRYVPAIWDRRKWTQTTFNSTTTNSLFAVFPQNPTKKKNISAVPHLSKKKSPAALQEAQETIDGSWHSTKMNFVKAILFALSFSLKESVIAKLPQYHRKWVEEDGMERHYRYFRVDRGQDKKRPGPARADRKLITKHLRA